MTWNYFKRISREALQFTWFNQTFQLDNLEKLWFHNLKWISNLHGNLLKRLVTIPKKKLTKSLPFVSLYQEEMWCDTSRVTLYYVQRVRESCARRAECIRYRNRRIQLLSVCSYSTILPFSAMQPWESFHSIYDTCINLVWSLTV